MAGIIPGYSSVSADIWSRKKYAISHRQGIDSIYLNETPKNEW